MRLTQRDKQNPENQCDFGAVGQTTGFWSLFRDNSPFRRNTGRLFILPENIGIAESSGVYNRKRVTA